RILTLAPPSEQVILGDQKRLEVETYARYRIVDPLRFYQACARSTRPMRNWPSWSARRCAASWGR
ncbi:hypothetical protein QNM99_05650, partial [Pseudomonas sp. PCH446]